MGPLRGPGSKGSQGSKGSKGVVAARAADYKKRGRGSAAGCVEGLCSLRSGGDSPAGLRVVDCPSGNNYEVSVTEIPFVSPRVHGEVQKPSSSGRRQSCRGLSSRANIRV